MDLDWGFWIKAAVLTVGTFGGCLALYQGLILPVKWLHPFFGLKSRTPSG